MGTEKGKFARPATKFFELWIFWNYHVSGVEFESAFASIPRSPFSSYIPPLLSLSRWPLANPGLFCVLPLTIITDCGLVRLACAITQTFSEIPEVAPQLRTSSRTVLHVTFQKWPSRPRSSFRYRRRKLHLLNRLKWSRLQKWYDFATLLSTQRRVDFHDSPGVSILRNRN